MGDPVHERDAAADAVRLAASAALEYLDSLDSAPLRHPNAVAASESLGAGSLPEEGDGTLAALRELTGPGMQAAIQSAGPRMFHFVTGGVTPAALGADWLATLVDQNALSWVSSPLASRLEAVSVDWLKELFRLPADWEGVITTGATMANFAALACARQWWAERHGVDLDARGFAGLPEAPVLSGGYVHASVRKALGMLGLGRDGVRTFSRDGAGRLDLDALGRRAERAGRCTGRRHRQRRRGQRGRLRSDRCAGRPRPTPRRVAARGRRLRAVRPRHAARRRSAPPGSSAPTR